MSSWYSVPHESVAGSHQSLSCSHALCKDRNDCRSWPATASRDSIATPLSTSAATSRSVASMSTVIPPPHKVLMACRGTCSGRVRTKRVCSCTRSRSSSAPSLAQKSSRKASLMRGAMLAMSFRNSCRRAAGSTSPPARSLLRAASSRALAPNLRLAPFRKVAWLAESSARCASISTSWLRSSRAPCTAPRRARCCERRSAGVALAKDSLAPLHEAAARSSSAATHDPS
mmetsp:Transcript_90753/g.236391  ORF Transcript_90753/g.236391 Transcript_90753/m.236391 type:complete len:229 (+) Transcript_90753:1799-2485(+)